MAHKLVSADCRGARPHDVASDQMGKGKRVGQRYLAGALEVGGVGLDELVGVDILHRPRRGSRHPVAAAAARGREREREREAGSVDAAALGARVRRRRAQDSYMAGFGHPTVAMG